MELEEQVRTVTAQRRQAERATTEVLAILDSQGFGGHLSDDSDQDGEEGGGKSRGDTAGAAGEEEEEPAAAKGETEDALSGTAQPGGLSWKGRSVSPRKATQLKQKQRRSSYFYLLSSSSDSSPKYRMGQSCRKNKRRIELRCSLMPERTSKFHMLLLSVFVLRSCLFMGQCVLLCSAMAANRQRQKTKAVARSVRSGGRMSWIARTMSRWTRTARGLEMNGVQGTVEMVANT